MKKSIKYLLFSIIIGFLFIHMFQQITGMVFVRSLKGYITVLEKPKFDFIFWFDKSYQEKTDAYLNQEFGFRNWYVRLNNQIYFDFYNQAKANRVVVGKENFVYEKEYIYAYYGYDFIGEDKIKEKVYKLKMLRDTLNAMNKQLMIVMAPGKATFYPEYIPDRYVRKSDTTNGMIYEKFFKVYGLPYINFNSHFLKIKNSAPYKLFPKGGIHWSNYGEYYALDSMVNFMNKNFNYNMPEISFGKIELSTAKKRDGDLEEGMNLIFPFSNEILAYPELIIDEKNKTKPNAIVISDSFYWGIYGDGVSSKIFNYNTFWFYYKQFIYGWDYKTRADINLKEEIKKTDIIILMASEHNIMDLGRDFINEAFNLFYTEFDIPEEYNILFVKNNIKSDRKWYSIIKKEARETKQPLEKVLEKHAKWTLQESMKKKKRPMTREEKIQNVMNEIRNNPEWLNQVKIKASQRNISLDEMIKIDAEWLVNEENK
ncbi:MAG: hypothetical protein A2W91_03640 [Bacteroidetes bacterium GWF2_38_335]|nr:MAG: hypothetical protein A2W91_03640 [Bacteroidetes bacterium GWF2_38_335]OFY77424.1 MAG: hypothetical protein A2281_01120 [Bacteroidetes bacterium RIFOXYA12_FULL_38_20]HBS87288.1 hypothetical protein [Bacteroidales bacterium]